MGANRKQHVSNDFGQFPRPVLRPSGQLDRSQPDADPALRFETARETAWALRTRLREEAASLGGDGGAASIRGPHLLRALEADTHGGIDDMAELWSGASERSLPGVLWRMYLLRAVIRQDAHAHSLAYRLGAAALRTIDPVVGGAADPTGPGELSALADTLLVEVHIGRTADALDRAAAVAGVLRAGWAELAHGGECAPEVVRRAFRFGDLAQDFRVAARCWRLGTLQ